MTGLSVVGVESAAGFVSRYGRLPPRPMGSEAGRLPENAGLGVAGVPPPPPPNRALSAEAWVASSVEQEQLLMTFREKLMMRNASWHFGSASEQPRACTRERPGRGRRAGRALAAGVRFAVSTASVAPLGPRLDFRQTQ